MFVDLKRCGGKRAVPVQGLRDRVGFDEEEVDIFEQAGSLPAGHMWRAQRRCAA